MNQIFACEFFFFFFKSAFVPFHFRPFQLSPPSYFFVSRNMRFVFTMLLLVAEFVSFHISSTKNETELIKEIFARIEFPLPKEQVLCTLLKSRQTQQSVWITANKPKIYYVANGRAKTAKWKDQCASSIRVQCTKNEC